MQEMQEIQERPYGATDETTVLEVYVALGTSQTCRGCRGNWKLGSLEAWKRGFFQYASPVALKGVPASPESPVGHAYWHVADVPGVQGELLPAGAWGSAPPREPSFQASKLLNFQ